jgi:SAM-dependent methyltransferase
VVANRIHRAPHQVVRYAPVLRALRKLPPGARVLEVGSGVEGLGTWYAAPFVGADIEFVGPRLPTLRPVVADGTRLPFPDRTFDLVANVDVLPELPGDVIAGMCADMARVARGSVVVVSVCGEDADRSNRRVMDWCERHRVEPPDWLVDLVEQGAPSVESIGDALAPFGRLIVAPNTSTAWNERMFRYEHLLRRAHLMTLTQPGIRWGGAHPVELAGRGPVYRWRFVLDVSASASPAAARS